MELYCAYVTILVALICSLTAYGYVTCPIQQAARSGVAKTIQDKKFIGGSILKLSFPSATNCYLECMATCLCAYANYKEATNGSGEMNCEMVKYTSCARNDEITIQNSKGWIAMEFSKVDDEVRKCCEANDLQAQLNTWCNTNYPGTYPMYSASQTSSSYLWRCYHVANDRYYYMTGHLYYSKHSSLLGVIESNQEFQSSEYILGGLGESCSEVCGSYGKQCSPFYNTLNAVYLFHRLALSCQYTKTSSDCFSEDNPPMFDPVTNKCTGFVNVSTVHDCGSYSSPSRQRLCKCIPYKFL